MQCCSLFDFVVQKTNHSLSLGVVSKVTGGRLNGEYILFYLVWLHLFDNKNERKAELNYPLSAVFTLQVWPEVYLLIALQ